MVNLADFGGPQFNPNPKQGPLLTAQQGTLFSNRRLNRANRTGDEVGHKGFSPNRLDAVRESVDVESVSALPADDRKLQPALSRIRQAYPEGAPNEYLYGLQDMARDSVHQEIARSTVPVDHLWSNLGWGGVKVPTQVSMTSAGGTSSYNHGTGRINLHPAHLDGGPLIHELGHRYDALSQVKAANDHLAEKGSLPPDGPADPIPGQWSGTPSLRHDNVDASTLANMEGFADAYADRHHVPHPGRGGATQQSVYSKYDEEQWGQYSANVAGRARPMEGSGAPEAYAESRAIHGGRDFRIKPASQRQFPGLHGF